MSHEITSKNRWAIVNRKSGKVRTSVGTRDEARINKRSTERVFDTVNQVFVR